MGKATGTISILAPRDVQAGEPIMLNHDPPSYDFRSLAEPLGVGDLDRLNRELNFIYIEAAKAELRQREADAKTTKRALHSLAATCIKLPMPALRILAAEIRRTMIEFGISLPQGLGDQELAEMTLSAVLRSANVKPSKQRGSPGAGARVWKAVCELVDLYCRETGTSPAYEFAGEWVKTASIEYAATVLHEWKLSPRGKRFDSQKLAAIWSEARQKRNSGEI